MNPGPPISDPSGHTPIPPPYYTPVDPAYQARQDAEQLNLLKIFYYIAAGLMAVSGLVFIFHIVMGFAIVFGAASSSTAKGAPSPGFGWLFIVMGTLALVAFETFAAFLFIAAKSLANREKKTLIQVVAALLCLNVPLGTALGVFTFIVLSRPSVAALFDAPRYS